MKQNIEFKSSYQKLDAPTFVKYDNGELNSYQNYLYKRALYGLKGLPETELATMCLAKQKRINKVHFRAQRLLNVYKHTITKKLTDSILLTLFPKSALAQSIAAYDEVDEVFTNSLSFKDLGISKEDIIELFIQEKILPGNFYSITPQDNPSFLPKLRTN
jgi:hypothetical protein